jgi:oxygen-dependent protoporphyrinogen oxidase
MTGLVPTRVAPFVTTKLLSPMGKLRVALEYAIPPRQEPGDESVEAFVVRRLGREMYDRLTEPLLSGISAADGARLSVAAMFPQLRALECEHRGLIRGMLATRRAHTMTRGHTGLGAPSAFVSFPRGLSEIVTAIERALCERDPGGARVRIRRRAIVSNIESGSDRGDFMIDLVSGERLASNGLIIATPAYVAAGMLRSVDRGLAVQLGEIEYASSLTVSVAYPEAAVPRALDATGYVVPRIMGRQVLACTWSSAKFQARAPNGYALFRIFLGGAKRPAAIGLSDAEVTDIVRDEMREVMGIRAKPVLQRIHRFDRAMPQYGVGHLDRVAAIHASAARTLGLHLAGAAYGGVGIPDCIRSARRAAEGVLRDLSITPTATAANTI